MKFMMLILFSFLLGACASNAAQSEENYLPPDPTSEPQVSIYEDALPEVLGRWELEPGTEIYTDETSVVTLQGRYRHSISGDTAIMRLSLFLDPAQAGQTVNDMLAKWRTETGHQIKTITAVTDQAYLIGYNQAALGLVNGNGVVNITVEMGSQHTDLDMLNMLQIGVEILENPQPPRPMGSMGSATLAPPVMQGH